MRRGDVNRRLDVNFSSPEYQAIIERLKTHTKIQPIGNLIKSWNRGDGPREGFYTEDTENGVYFLRVNNLTNHTVDVSEVKHITREVHEKTLARTKSKPGDLIFAVSGTKDNLGTVAIIPPEIKEANLNSALINLRIDEELISKEFFCWFVDSQVSRTQIEFIGKGVAQNNLNVEEISEILIPLPSLEIQRELVNELEAARTARCDKLAQADALLSGLDGWLLAKLDLQAPKTEKRAAFGVKLGQVNSRLDTDFHSPEFTTLSSLVKSIPHERLENLAVFSSETWQPEKSSDAVTFRYIEISGVNPKTGSATAENVAVSEAPSRARMQVRDGDIIISTTRPHYGAIAQIETDLDGAIASTGFSVIRRVDERINKAYLWSILRSSLCLRQMFFRSSGGNYPAITQGELEKLIIPLPDKAIQESIAAEVRTRRERARALRDEAAHDWEAAKARFEARLLGGETA